MKKRISGSSRKSLLFLVGVVVIVVTAKCNTTFASIITTDVNNNDDQEDEEKERNVEYQTLSTLAQKLIDKEHNILQAARILRRIKNLSLLTTSQRIVLENAKICQDAINDLLLTPSLLDDDGTSNGWKKQYSGPILKGKNSNDILDATIYYKIDDSSSSLGSGSVASASSSRIMTCRLETPIPSNLLIPLISVLNESNLYHTWQPRWNYPFKLGLRNSKQLYVSTKKSSDDAGCNTQIIQIQCDVPWPMLSREILFHTLIIDDIKEHGIVAIQMKTLKDKENNDNDDNDDKDDDSILLPQGFEIPSLEPNMERIDFNGFILFRSCPKNHENYQTSKQRLNDNDDNDNDDNNNLILIQFIVCIDAHMKHIPQSMINFITRTVIGHIIWSKFLHIAQEIRDNHYNRIEHLHAINSNPNFYNWVKERSKAFLLTTTATTTAEEDEEDEVDEGQQLEEEMPVVVDCTVPTTTSISRVAKGSTSRQGDNS